MCLSPQDVSYPRVFVVRLGHECDTETEMTHPKDPLARKEARRLSVQS